jgi:hypothetical protein
LSQIFPEDMTIVQCYVERDLFYEELVSIEENLCKKIVDAFTILTSSEGEIKLQQEKNK